VQLTRRAKWVLLISIQSDEFIPAHYEMTPEEYAEFQEEYNEWADEQDANLPEHWYDNDDDF